MFLEEKKSGIYLGKKISGKTFLVKIFKNTIDSPLVENLTKKEISFLEQRSGYKKFF
jgi:hypothetical protein